MTGVAGVGLEGKDVCLLHACGHDLPPCVSLPSDVQAFLPANSLSPGASPLEQSIHKIL